MQLDRSGVIWGFLVIAAVMGWSESRIEAADNVIVITLDGLRWEEVFTGADERLINKDDGGVESPDLTREKYWRESAADRRETLMPFFWNTIAKEGQLWGDPESSAMVTVTNGKYFSYPGYNELLSGRADDEVDSNDKIDNRNTTVLEWLHQRPAYAGKVAAFTSWDVFPYIINQRRSGIPVNAGWQPLEVASDDATLNSLNQMASELPHYWQGVRFDAVTFQGALHYLKVKQPRVLYVSLGETDDWAHAGRYDLYLDAARASDNQIRQLWETVQSMEGYRGNTALLISTDHGRGNGRQSWKSHGADLPEARFIWFAAMGPDVAPLGLRKQVEGTQSQFAATIADQLGLDFTTSQEGVAPAFDVRTKADQ